MRRKKLGKSGFSCDEYSNYFFRYKDWEVCIWNDRIAVSSPSVLRESHEVDVYDEGLYVRGAMRGAWEDFPATVAIPWPVLEAIIAARTFVMAQAGQK